MRSTAVAFLLFATTWASSTRADDKTTCTNAYVNGQTRRGEHKLIAARDELRTCARRECSSFMSGQLVKDCADWLTQVEASLPSVVLSAKDSSGAQVTDVTVSIDGSVIATKLDGRAIDVDPGSHIFAFEAPNAKRVAATAVVREGAKDQLIEVVVERTAPALATKPERSNSSPQDAPPLNVGADVAADHRGAWPQPGETKTVRSVSPWTYAALGIGAAGIAAGSVLGVLALQTKSRLNGECQDNGCVPGSEGDIDALHKLSWGSNIGFGVGVLGAGIGIVLLATTGRSLSSDANGPRRGGADASLKIEPWVGVGSGGVGGTFR
jgi:hypothetical protein